MWKKRTKQNNAEAEHPSLNTNEGQRKCQHNLDRKLLNLTQAAPNTTWCATDKLKGMQTIIRQAGEASVSLCKNNKHTKNYDHELSILSKKQKDLRIRMQNLKNTDQKSTLKTERNKILHNIRARQIKLNNKEIDRNIEGKDLSKNDSAMFKATRLLNQKTFENPKVEDSEEKLATRPGDILDIVSNYFKDKFVDSDQDVVPPFQGAAKPLRNKIRTEEVRKSFNSLSDNKAPGEDNINGELLKHGTPLLDKTIADIYNTTFEKHEDLDINGEDLIAIQKPGKKKGPPGNLRPITLLNSLCKALLIVTLNRIRLKVKEYLSKNQSEFRPDRSTADVIWTHRWLAAKALKEETSIKILGIDMPAAFHTINRCHLLKIVKSIVDEDQHRLIQFLLSGTVIDTSKPFTSNVGNVGTTQGDSLSPGLFTIVIFRTCSQRSPTHAAETNNLI